METAKTWWLRNGRGRGAAVAGTAALLVAVSSCSHGSDVSEARQGKQVQAAESTDGGSALDSGSVENAADLAELENALSEIVPIDYGHGSAIEEVLDRATIDQLRQLALFSEKIRHARFYVIREIGRRDVPGVSEVMLAEIESRAHEIPSDERLVLEAVALSAGYVTPPEGQDLLDRLLTHEIGLVRNAAEISVERRAN